MATESSRQADNEWLLKMAEKEDGKCISAGGWVAQVNAAEQTESSRQAGDAGGVRDAGADLAVCEAVPVGPWFADVDRPSAGGAVSHPNTVRMLAYPHRHIAALPSYDQAVTRQKDRVALLEFIALAREALPHWIKRATDAEAERQRLAAELAAVRAERDELLKRAESLCEPNRSMVLKGYWVGEPTC